MFNLLKKLFLKNKSNILFFFLINAFLGFFIFRILSFFFFLISLNIVNLFFLHKLFFFEVDEVEQENFFAIYFIYWLFIFLVFFIMRLIFLFFSFLYFCYHFSFIFGLKIFTSELLFSFLEFFLLSFIYFFIKKYSISNIRFLLYFLYFLYFNFFLFHLFGIFLNSICSNIKICLLVLFEIKISTHLLITIFFLTTKLIPEIYFYCFIPSVILWLTIYFLNILFELNRAKKVRKNYNIKESNNSLLES